MVGTTEPEKTTCNRHQFLWMAHSLSGFKNLVTEVGDENAELIANLLFDRQVTQTNPEGRYILVAADERPAYPNVVDNLLLAEWTQIQEKRAYVEELLEATMAGVLRDALADMTEPEGRYVQPRKRRRGTPPPSPLEQEILKACDWIARSLHDDSKQAIHRVLTKHILTAPKHAALGRNVDLLDQIHADVVTDAPRVRSPNSTTAYPSSVGGRFLLELVFKWTSTALWPKPGDDQWKDIALFYLGAVGSVQGYPDGNKRAARMAYAITLLKGKHPFVAPGSTLESALIRMNRDT